MTEPTIGDHIYRYNALAAVYGPPAAAESVNRQMAHVGCAILLRPDGRAWLAIAEDHPGVDALFAGSAWGEGQWRAALREAPDSVRAEAAVTIDGAAWRCVLLAIEAVV